MPTTIATPSPNLAKIRFQEQYVSEGLNKKFNGVIPAGVIRGGNLISAGAGLNVTIEADADKGDSVYSYIDANGHQLTFRQVGNVNLDLAAAASTTVYVCLFIQYTTAATTVVEWRTYTEAELITAPVAEAPYLVVLGQVVVPAAGPIPDANVTPLERREAGFDISTEIREWKQVIVNGDWELSGTEAAGALSGDWVYGWSTITGGTGYDAYMSTSAPLVGTHELEVRADGVDPIVDPTVGTLNGFFRARAGDLVKGRINIRGASWTAVGASGHAGMRISFYDEDFQFISAETVGIDSTYSGTFAYESFERIVRAPSGSRWVRFLISVDTDGVTPSAAVSLFFDDLKAWIKRDPVNVDSRAEDYFKSAGADLIGGQLILSPAPTTVADSDELLERSLAKRNIGAQPGGIVVGELVELVQEFLKGVSGAAPVGMYQEQRLGGHQAFLHTADRNTQREVGWQEFFSFDAVGTKDLQVAYDFGDGTVRTDVGRLRLYTSNSVQAGGLPSGFEVSFNAAWDISAATWVRDVAGVDAWLVAVTDDGIRLFTKLAAGGASWADPTWDQATAFPLFALSLNTLQRGLFVSGLGGAEASIGVPTLAKDTDPGDGFVLSTGVTLHQQTVVKSWGHVELDGSGNIITTDGYNFSAARVGDVLGITFVNTLANGDYAVVGAVSDEAGAIRSEFVTFANLATTGFTLAQHDDTGAAVALATTAGVYTFIVFGEA